MCETGSNETGVIQQQVVFSGSYTHLLLRHLLVGLKLVQNFMGHEGGKYLSLCW